MGYLSHNWGSREVGGDFHPQTLLWAARMASASYTVTGYQKRIHTTFCNALKSAGCLSSPIQFIAPVWGAAAPNMVSVLVSPVNASVVGTFSYTGNAIKPLDTASWIRSGLDVGNWPSGLTLDNSGQLYYVTGSNNASEFDMGVRNFDGVTPLTGLNLGNIGNSVGAQSGTSVNPITYGAVASETEHLLCFNSSPEGQQLMKQIAPNVVSTIGSVQPIGSGAIPNNVYPFCGLHTIGSGVQLNTIGRSHKAFMVYKDATNAQAQLICKAVYNFVNSLPI